MKRKIVNLVTIMLVILTFAITFVACTNGGETKAKLESTTETQIVMVIEETDGSANAFDALKSLRDQDLISFDYTTSQYGSYITSINGKAEAVTEFSAGARDSAFDELIHFFFVKFVGDIDQFIHIQCELFAPETAEPVQFCVAENFIFDFDLIITGSEHHFLAVIFPRTHVFTHPATVAERFSGIKGISIKFGFGDQRYQPVAGTVFRRKSHIVPAEFSQTGCDKGVTVTERCCIGRGNIFIRTVPPESGARQGDGCKTIRFEKFT